MPNDAMTASELLRSAESLSVFSEAESFVTNVSNALQAGTIAKEDSLVILMVGFRRFLEATIDAPAEGEKAIFRWILPACLEVNLEAGEPNLDAHRMRELLATWIDQYPDQYKVPLRAKALAEVQSRLGSNSPIPAVWTVSVIGLRTPQLELDLQRLTQRNDNVGDAAIECLASLFPSTKIRSGIVQKVLRRLGTRKAHEFFSAISTIGDVRFIPALSRKLLGEEKDEMVNMSLLGRIADKSPLDMALQERIWRVFGRAISSNNEVLRSILFTGNGLTLCNISEVIPALTQLLREKRTGSYLVHARLKECVRPTQLLGWSRVDKQQLKSLLSPAATVVTGNRTRSATVEDHNRDTAWDTGLSAGISDVADWLAAAMVETSGPFEKRDALTFSSYYRLGSWPEQAEKLVLEEFRLEERQNVPISDRIAAVEFFVAVATFEALSIVLRSGITSRGSPLRSTAQAVAELAAWLAKSDVQGVAEQLLNLCESPEISNSRMLAIAGLESLADRNLIPPNALPRLARVAQDPSLPKYATAAAIWATSCYPEAALLPDYVAFLTRNIAEIGIDFQIRFQSFQSLVRLGIWRRHEDKFVEMLDLIESSPRLVPSKPERYQAWQALLLMQLAIRVPEEFLDAVIAVIENARPDAVHAVLQVCSRTHQQSTAQLQVVAKAAIARALRTFSSSYVEADTFTLMARLAPDPFVRTEWEQVWGDWMPEARAALARAIEQNASALTSDLIPRVLALLEMLLSDSVYRIRRIAARVYAHIDISNLSDLCKYWSESGNSSLRLRAAEIAQYLPPNESPALDNIFLRTLREDPEKRIRDAAAEGITGLRNRVWAAQLLDLIRAGRNRQANEWVAQCYCYGRALTAVGDDETLNDLRTLTSDPTIPPNVRNWLQSVENALDEHWKDVMRNWPEPSLPWAGALEQVQIDFALDDHSLNSRLILWRQRTADPRGVVSWGGGFFGPPGLQSLQYLSGSTVRPRLLRINGRTEAQIWISSVGTHGLVSFVGHGPYPEVLSRAGPDGDP